MQYASVPVLRRQSRAPQWCRLALVSLIAFGSLLVLPASASAFVSTGDGGWVWQSPLPMGNQLNGVAFATTQIGWAVSTGGVILHTSDGGLTWMAQRSGTTSDLKAVTCASTAVAWAVGMSGTVVHTTDGGTTWSAQGAGTGANLYAVACAGTASAWAVGSGGVITHTGDGDTWTTQTSNTGALLHGVACYGALDAWAVGSGVIRHTSDGGSTWSVQTPQTPGIVFEAVACSDTLDAWAVGDAGAIERTTDGGVTWTDAASGAAASNLMGVAAASASRVWAVGTGGVALSSTNGGEVWLGQTSGTTAQLMAVACSGTSHAWAVGAFGTVISTDGAAWASGSSAIASGLNAVALMGGVPLAVGTAGAIEVWDPISQQWLSKGLGVTAYDLAGVASSGSANACAVGAHGTLLVTTDGGATWTDHHMYQVNANLSGVSYGAKYVVAVGQGEQTCLSDNGGQNWFAEGTGYIGDLYAVTTYSLGTTDYAVAVGSGGVIERSTNGGLSWGPPETTPVYKDLYGVTSVVSGTNVSLWAVGAAGTILYSTDGQHWTAQTSHTTASLRSVNAQGPKLFAVGDSGTIDYSADGGATWTPQHSGTSSWLNGVVVGPLDTGWVVGTYGTLGTILYTDTDGIGAPADTQPPSAISGLSSSTHPDPATWYASTTPGFSWDAASDPTPGSGLKDYVYLLDHSAGTTIDVTTASTHATGGTTVTLASTADGTWCFHVCARDNAGNYGPTATRTVRIDAAAPITTAVGAPATWQHAPAQVTLQATDTASGVAGSWWELDKTPGGLPPSDWTAGLGPITISAEGSHTLYFYSIDNYGNVESPQSVVVRIDTGAPTTTPATVAPAPNAAGWNSSDVTVTLHPDDGSGSGIAKTQYAPHGTSTWSDAAGNQFPVPAPASHANDGVHVYDYRALDNAGNFSDLGAVTVKIDSTAPSTSMPGGVPSGWSKTPVLVTLQGGDSGSGLIATQYRLAGAATWTPYAAPFSVSTQGASTYEYRSLDAAGNAETPKSFTTRIDSQPPSTTAYAVKAKHNKSVSLAYRISDPSPGCGTASVTLKIFKGSKLKKSLAAGSCTTNAKVGYKWRCVLPKGSYTLKVYAIDAAGNAQTRVGSAKLTVK